MPTLTSSVSRLLLRRMTSSLAVEVVVTVVEVATRVLVRIAVVAERDVEESLSLTTTPSQLYEQAVPASAAHEKVNIKCPSHYPHAFRCG